jgi:LysM repeat protein
MPTRTLLPRVALAASLIALLAPASASAYFAHVVAPGETLSSVAAQDGLSVAALAAANGISPDSELVAGSVLEIPPQGTAGLASQAVAPASQADPDDAGTLGASPADNGAAAGSDSGGYVVQPGDTLTAIAARAGTSVAELAAYNGLDPNNFLLTGSTLRLPPAGSATAEYVSSSPSPASPGAVAESQPVGPAALSGSGDGPYPTAETVTGPEIAGIAAGTGTPAALAQAIGWQESGWNNDEVSPTGAVGVMQIEPGTWDWIQRTLTAGTALSPYSAADNVRGGSLLLHSLLAATGSDSMAAAAYYQGLSSVQQHGMFPDTQQYVNDVMSLEQRFGGG